MPEVHITFPMDCSRFKPSVRSMREDEKSDAVTAAFRKVNEVRVMDLTKFTMSGETRVMYWSLIFPLKGFRLHVNALRLMKQKANQLFGHVVHRQMLQPFIHLSAAPLAERRHLKPTLESR